MQVAAKTYYSKTAMGRFPFSFGGEALFVYGRYITTDSREQDELDAIIPPRGNNPNIYTADQIAIENRPPVAQNAASEIEIAAMERGMAAGGNNLRVQQETGPVVISPPNAADVNNSAIDPALRAFVDNPAAVTPVTQPPVVVNPGGTKFQQNNAELGIRSPSEVAAQIQKAREEAAIRLQQSQGNQG